MSLVQKLTTILLSYCVLDIPYSAVGDHCLQIIGTSCKELKELNISHCSGVTDLGIEGLCVRVNHSGRTNERHGECKKICKLSTAGTQITKQGVQLALSNLPSLKVWNEVSVQLLYNIHYIDFFTKNLEDIPKYSLINICVSDWRYDPLNTPYIRESLNLIVSICPYIMEMKIMAVSGLKDSDLQSLLSLERLSELHIGEFENECEITFKDGIAPILKGIGSSLKTLSLSRIRGINIQVIMEHCTGLRSLTLKFHSDCGTFWKEEDTTKKEDKKRIKLDQRVLWQLEKLSLFTGSNGSFYSCPIGSNNLMSLLVTPTLRYISIHDCTTLTDSILEEAEKFHNFRNLEYLELYGCHSVTESSIDLLMNDNNALKQIVLHHCKLFTQDAVDCWKDEINANNWFVSIDYWNFEPAPENNSSSSHSSECEYGDYYYDN
ncbi:uncharacterized protein LOC124202853 isoform X3 [Daphnia pulex]|uniref:uncharacterized protein LOC124202853 isoform X3 n=1 Tax=Daphnia pulex TaxID=6669 RepID=UPI001EE07B25|nr:uncharacterized protein LOC124202853 isoform X3 [Daphnia pulex]